MPIRPLDMQVAIPKLAEVSRMSHLEQQKAGLQQNQTAVTGERNNERQTKTVQESNKDEKAGSEADARKEGRNRYQKRDSKGKGSADPLEGDQGEPDSYHKIDIRI